MKYKNTMIEYLEQRKEEKFEKKWGMLSATIASILLVSFLLYLWI